MNTGTGSTLPPAPHQTGAPPPTNESLGDLEAARAFFEQHENAGREAVGDQAMNGNVPSPLSSDSPAPPNEHPAASPMGPGDTPTATSVPRGQGALGHESQPLDAVATFDGLSLTQSDLDWLQKGTMSEGDSTPVTPTPPPGARSLRNAGPPQPAMNLHSARGSKNRKRARVSYSSDESTHEAEEATPTALPLNQSQVRSSAGEPAHRGPEPMAEQREQPTGSRAFSFAGTAARCTLSMPSLTESPLQESPRPGPQTRRE